MNHLMYTAFSQFHLHVLQGGITGRRRCPGNVVHWRICYLLIWHGDSVPWMYLYLFRFLFFLSLCKLHEWFNFRIWFLNLLVFKALRTINIIYLQNHNFWHSLSSFIFASIPFPSTSITPTSSEPFFLPFPIA